MDFILYILYFIFVIFVILSLAAHDFWGCDLKSPM